MTRVTQASDFRSSLRRRHRAVGGVIATLGVAAVAVPLTLLWPLGTRDDGAAGIDTGTEAAGLVVSARVPIARGITDVVTGFGSVWITGNNGVARVDPVTNRVIDEIPVPGTGDYSHIAVGEGSVWVVAPELRADGSGGNLVRIDPATNAIAATIHIGGPIEWVAVADGSVWVTLPDSGASTLFRVDPGSDRVVGSVALDEGAGPVVVGHGSLWITNQWMSGSVTRIDPAADEVVDRLDVSSVQAVGDGSLWGTTGDAVLRVDPDSGTVQATVPIPRAQDVAFDGSTVWVLVSPRSSDPTLFEPIAGTAAVVRIDPATDRVVGEPVALDDLQPIGLATDEIGAWVVDYYDGFLSRIEPFR